MEHARKQQVPKETITSSDTTALEEFDQKTTLFLTMTKFNSFKKSPKQRALYHALMESTLEDEDAMDEGVAEKLKKKKPNDADKDEGPSAGLDRGFERQRTSKGTETSKKTSAIKDSSKGKYPCTSSKPTKSGKSAKDQVVEPISVHDSDNAEHDDAKLDNTDMPVDQGEDLEFTTSWFKIIAAGEKVNAVRNRSRFGINKWYQSFALRNFDLEETIQKNPLLTRKRWPFQTQREVGVKTYEFNMLKTEFEKVKQEKEGIDFKIEKFENASKDLDKLLGSQITNNSKKGLGMDISDMRRMSLSVVEKKIVVPTIPKVDVVRPKQQEKPVRKTVSFNHLIKDYKRKVQKPIWNNARRVNHHNSPRMSYPHPKRNFVPKAVLMKTGMRPVNAAKPKDAHNAVKRNRFNAVKASACWVWMPKNRVVDHMDAQAQGRQECSKEKEESREECSKSRKTKKMKCLEESSQQRK
ncbi:hypothetical protein Tco_0007578 [Tanacetum coccineum]